MMLTWRNTLGLEECRDHLRGNESTILRKIRTEYLLPPTNLQLEANKLVEEEFRLFKRTKDPPLWLENCRLGV